MCAGALLQARVDRVVYGTNNPLLGADGSWMQILPLAKAKQAELSTSIPEQELLRRAQQQHPFHVSMHV